MCLNVCELARSLAALSVLVLLCQSSKKTRFLAAGTVTTSAHCGTRRQRLCVSSPFFSRSPLLLSPTASSSFLSFFRFSFFIASSPLSPPKVQTYSNNRANFENPVAVVTALGWQEARRLLFDFSEAAVAKKTNQDSDPTRIIPFP